MLNAISEYTADWVRGRAEGRGADTGVVASRIRKYILLDK
jgi:hypothetical protein